MNPTKSESDGPELWHHRHLDLQKATSEGDFGTDANHQLPKTNFPLCRTSKISSHAAASPPEKKCKSRNDMKPKPKAKPRASKRKKAKSKKHWMEMMTSGLQAARLIVDLVAILTKLTCP
ncbi:hypothetical protein HNQ64_002539 [Prosthecobacter dejongeii]|uniref:Uncharacterized protein n=1 Tax=Prosthecobacter dejongeii TaxID=48465 RepID=A0A7W7YL94_9BACT|nr:hypothetical protein [Prosthecobacter dejongeii]